MWRKIKNLFNPEKHQEEEDKWPSELITFDKKDPIDVVFTKNFTNAGGIFFYCDDDEEALEFLKDIIENEGIDEMVCSGKKLVSFLNTLNIKYSNNVKSDDDFIFMECEYLISFDGAIMVSSHQTSGRNAEELPENIIIYATTDQFVVNLSEALQKLKRIKGESLPNNITSLKGKMAQDLSVSSNAKNIYLLLVEKAQ